MIEKELEANLAYLGEKYLDDQAWTEYHEYLCGPDALRQGKFFFAEISLKKTSELSIEDKKLMKEIAYFLGF